jgi:hypothetical protein
LFLRFYESSVLMRFLFLSSFSAFFMLRMYNSMVRIGFESDSNRIRIGFEPDSNRIRTGIIFNFLYGYNSSCSHVYNSSCTHG